MVGFAVERHGACLCCEPPLLQNIRRDFVPGVLSEEELGNKLYVHELSKVRVGLGCAIAHQFQLGLRACSDLRSAWVRWERNGWALDFARIMQSSHQVQEYAARVHNLRSYDAISRDVLARWAYPFVPDTNLATRSSGPTHYTYGRGRIYM